MYMKGFRTFRNKVELNRWPLVITVNNHCKTPTTNLQLSLFFGLFLLLLVSVSAHSELFHHILFQGILLEDLCCH